MIKRNKKGQFVKGSGIGKDNVNWKGDEVSYTHIHTWINRHKEKKGGLLENHNYDTFRFSHN